MKRHVLYFLFPFLLQAQAGLTPAWEVQKTLDALVAQTRRLAPMMEEIKAKEWVAKGAPEGYLEQHQAVRNQINYLVQTTQELKAHPDRMADTVETYLRLQSLESLLDSLSQGVRRYQNPALADLLQGMIVENDANRQQLRTYMVELISNKEAELKIMNEEAQRCRGMLIRQPPTPKPKAAVAKPAEATKTN